MIPKVDPKDNTKLISTANNGFHNSKHKADSRSACKVRYVPPCITTYPLNSPIMADRNTGGLQPTIVQYSKIKAQVMENSTPLRKCNRCNTIEIMRNNKAI